MSIFEKQFELSRNNIPFVVITMISSRGHAPQDAGAKAVVTEKGLEIGTVGGGKIEARTISFAQGMLSKNEKTPVLKTWNLQTDIGMSCGGEVTLLFEVHKTNWKIAVFGAGHVAQALVPMLGQLRCFVSCMDPRSEWTTRFAPKENLLVKTVPNASEEVSSFCKNTYFVVMTQGHATDVPILKEIFRQFPNAPYIGVIGSTLKALKIKNELQKFGIEAENLKRLRCPMGINLGSNDPAEIAVSITAELIQVRDALWKEADNPKKDKAQSDRSQEINP